MKGRYKRKREKGIYDMFETNINIMDENKTVVLPAMGEMTKEEIIEAISGSDVPMCSCDDVLIEKEAVCIMKRASKLREMSERLKDFKLED